MSFIVKALVKFGISDRRRDRRMHARGLHVSYWTGSEEKRVKVKDISAAGIYIHTDEQWTPGTAVELILQKRSLLHHESHSTVRLRARCVRLDEHGVGLSFVENPDNAERWSSAMAKAAEIIIATEPVRLFRTTRALAFLHRISPEAENGLMHMIAGGFSWQRADRALEIVLMTEELLVSRGCESPSAVSPAAALRILETGSKAAEEETQQLWAGLLASSCMDEQQNYASQHFAVLLSKLDSVHALILTAACSRAVRLGWNSGYVLPQPLHCTADEIRRISRIRNLVAIERHLHHLHFLGLLERTGKPLGCAQLEQVNITPTGLGLRFYARCCGLPELPEAMEPSVLEMAS